ncbi:MAG TPA: hypothetical protein VHD55_03300 [Candidatus Paceibacterota bacterium]|nr:hypothetical protein [Candidatus Paceibacterota bacterium]
MEHIGSHLKGASPAEGSRIPGRPAQRRERMTERGEMMEYFRTKLNASRIEDGLTPLTMPRMGKILEAIPTKDLYALKSMCDQAKHFSKKFWWEINPKNHTPEAKAKAAAFIRNRVRSENHE